MTIDDIAKKLGVSATTVSRAISGKGRLSEATRERVNAYIKEINYRPNALASGLAKQKTFNIGVIWPSHNEAVELPFFQHCLMGMSDVTGDRGYDLLVCPVSEDDYSGLRRIVEYRKVDGFVLTRSLLKDSAADYLLKQNVPVVLIGTNERYPFVQVDNDNFSACRDLTAKLIADGGQRIALIGGDSRHVITQTRQKGFEAGFAVSGKTCDPSLIFLDVQEKDMEALMQKLLMERADVLVSMDDKIAEMVLCECRRRHIRIPDDVQLASFYDSTILQETMPGITAVQFDANRLGAAAAETLMNLIDGETVTARSVSGYRICERESTQKSVQDTKNN